MSYKSIGLIAFVRQGQPELIQNAIAAGRDVNVQDENGMTALHHAAADGYRAAIRLLVASGKCDFLLRDHQGRYASELAIQWGRDYAVGRLLSLHQLRQAKERGVPAYERPGEGETKSERQLTPTPS